VFQAFHLIPSMTALENVEAPLFINPRRFKARAIACHILGEVGLGYLQLGRQLLSGGWT